MASEPEPLSVLALNCTLKPASDSSSTDLLIDQLLAQIDDAAGEGAVTSEVVRVVDLDVRPGVEADMGDGDQWPTIREKLLAADLLVLGTPTWVGQPSSVCQRVIERLDAELSYTDDAGRPHLFDKVALAVVVGNEDGAHHITGILWQCLSDVGFTVPAQGVTYWNDEAMGSRDFKDLDETPDTTASTTRTAAVNGVHLARTLRIQGYPAA